MNLLDKIAQNVVVPVVVIEDSRNAVATARALWDGGIGVMEITLRTTAGLESIRLVAQEVPEMIVGAGTVVNVQQAQAVVKAGGQFIVAPGFDEPTVKWCVEHDMPIVPGCVTPTEIMRALQYNLKVLKFFPADVYGGLKALKSLAGPFNDLKFIPTGGVSATNIAQYASVPFIATVGGSWICTAKDIREENFGKITELCKEAVANAAMTV